MADNFNLRSFLSENRLTKNAQLLKEQEEAPIQGLNLVVLDDQEGGDITLEKYSDMDEKFQQIFNDGLEEGEWEATSLEQGLAELDEYFEERGDPTQQEAYDTAKQQFQSAVQGKQGRFYVHGVEYDLQLMFIESPSQEGEGNLDETRYSDSYDSSASQKVAGQLDVAMDRIPRAEITSVVDKLIAAAEQQTRTQVTPREKRVLVSQANHIYINNAEMERESVDNKKPIMKETKLTTKERRLVEMVQRALKEDNGYATHDGSFGGDDSEENVDYTMGNQDDPNQLPNPAPELNIPEGEANIEETKPLPKYNSIEELMKEIEHGTNEAAHKYKMEEMKRVYEALEAKVSSLEEGEHAEHIDQKAVKQMRKDIAALRKAEEKLRKEFEKKFTGKDKKEEPKKDKEAVALQEGTFDLRKYLAENRK